VIARIWHGWTTREKADDYQSILLKEVMPRIASRAISGYHGFHSLRRETRGEAGRPEAEFITIMWFDNEDAIREFVGDDFGVAQVPARAREVLSRFDERSAHYEVLHTPGEGARVGGAS